MGFGFWVLGLGFRVRVVNMDLGGDGHLRELRHLGGEADEVLPHPLGHAPAEEDVVARAVPGPGLPARARVLGPPIAPARL